MKEALKERISKDLQAKSVPAFCITPSQKLKIMKKAPPFSHLDFSEF